jgi:DNA-binding NtrC family response regulator
MKILVVDDEVIVLDSCKRVLEADGYSVALANSADKALEAMGREAFSLILLDIKMPGRDGMSLVKEVKEKWREIPVVVMSGYATRETMAQVSMIEAATFIAKPFTPDELGGAIRKVLQQEESHG